MAGIVTLVFFLGTEWRKVFTAYIIAVHSLAFEFSLFTAFWGQHLHLVWGSALLLLFSFGHYNHVGWAVGTFCAFPKWCVV